MNIEGQETGGSAPEMPRSIDPAIVQQYQEQFQALQARNAQLEEENNIRRLREMRLYEEQERSRGQQMQAPVEEDLPIDPEAKKVLDKYIQRVMTPVQSKVQGLENQLAQAQAKLEANNNVELIRRGAPFIDQVSAEIMREIQSLPPDEQLALSRSPNTIIRMAHMIFNQKGGRGNAGQKAATQMAAVEQSSASHQVIQTDGPWWRAKGYSNLNAEERAKADAEIAQMRGR